MRKWRCTFVVKPLNHIHQDTKSARLIAVCKRSFYSLALTLAYVQTPPDNKSGGVFIIRRSLHAGYTNSNPNINPNLNPNPNHIRVKKVKKDYILGLRLFEYWAKDNEPTDHSAECSAFLNMQQNHKLISVCDLIIFLFSYRSSYDTKFLQKEQNFLQNLYQHETRLCSWNK